MRRTQARNISWAWPAAFLLALVFGILSVGRAVAVYLQARTAFRETQGIEDAIAQREREIRELEERLAKIKSGEGLEMEARGRLNLQKPGEQVVVIVEDTEGEGVPPSSSEFSWWRAMLGWIGIAW